MSGLQKLYQVVSGVVGDGALLTIQPSGNHGDGLIRIGCNKFFYDNDIGTVPFRPERLRADNPPPLGVYRPDVYYRILQDYVTYAKHSFSSRISAIYIHGGANFNDFWSSGSRCYKTAARFFDVPIIVGPQSGVFEDTNIVDLFDGVDNPTYFFCRDEYSYELLADALSNVSVNLYLEDDTALYLDAADLPTQKISSEYNLLALRRDKESRNVLIDEPVSPPIRVGDISIDEPDYESFVKAGARARRIYTDRLHGAILAILLEKPVTFYENAYHKNRGVYEYSLSGYDNVDFVYEN